MTNKPLKLKMTNIGLACVRACQLEEIATTLHAAEKRAPVTVHSHGKLIADAIWHAESVLECLKAFKAEVEER